MSSEKISGKSDEDSSLLEQSDNIWQSLSEEPSYEDHMNTVKREQADNKIYEKDGILFLDLSKIDLSTDDGRIEYLQGYIDNERKRLEQLKANGGYYHEGIERLLARNKYQEKVLSSIMQGEDGVINTLIQKSKNLSDTIQKGGQNVPSLRDYKEYIDDLCSHLAHALCNQSNLRETPYFSTEIVKNENRDRLAKAEIELDDRRHQLEFLSDKDVDDKGVAHLIHYDTSGRPKEITVDLNDVKDKITNIEIDMRQINEENEVLDELERREQIPRSRDILFAFNSPLHKVTKKETVKPNILSYIDECTSQINALLGESKGLEKDTPEYQQNDYSRKRLARKRSAARRILVNYFSENPQRPAQNETQEAKSNSQIDVVSALEQMDADRDDYEKNLALAEQEKQRRIEWEKTHYGYIEGNTRPPLSVLAAEETVEKIRTKITQKEQDADLLYKIYKENGKNRVLSKADAEAVVAKMIQERDIKIAALDKEIEKVEKKSEEWKRLRQERRKVYLTIKDDTAQRVLTLFE